MRIYKKIFCILLLCTLLLSACSGNGGSSPLTSENADSGSASTAGSGSFTLPYTATDTLNPYAAMTKSNQELSRLLYDSLVKINNQFEPQYALAESAALEGTTCTITLRSAAFSDGSAVTGADVITSLASAQAKGSLYADRLSNISSKSVNDAGQVVITLKHADEYFVHLLDFPVYKAGTESRENEDHKKLPPTGSGRYVYQEDSGSYWLQANENWYGGTVGISRIELLNLPDDDALDRAIQMNSLSLYYSDMSDNTFPSMTGRTVSVPLANLVYLGVNTQSGTLADVNLRAALSAALDRSALASGAYYGMADAAKGPFPSGWNEAEGLQTGSTAKNLSEAVAKLSLSGYNEKDSKGYFLKNGHRLNLTLTYNSDNTARAKLAELMVSQLADAGIQLTVRGLSYTDYTAAVAAGCELYLAEMRLPDNFDLYPLTIAGTLLSASSSSSTSSQTASSASSQVSSKSTLQDSSQSSSAAGEDVSSSAPAPLLSAREAAKKMHDGTGTMTEALSCLNAELSIIPICHRRGIVTCTEKLSGSLDPTATDPFNGLESCTVNP